MAAGTVLVDVRLFVDPVLLAIVDQVHSLFEVLDLLLSKAHHVGTEIGVADDLEILVVFVEEVIDRFIVNFEV